MSEIDELSKKYGENVPVGMFVGVKQAQQALNKFHFDIVMGNLTSQQSLDALAMLAGRIEARLDSED